MFLYEAVGRGLLCHYAILVLIALLGVWRRLPGRGQVRHFARLLQENATGRLPIKAIVVAVWLVALLVVYVFVLAGRRYATLERTFEGL